MAPVTRFLALHPASHAGNENVSLLFAGFRAISASPHFFSLLQLDPQRIAHTWVAARSVGRSHGRVAALSKPGRFLAVFRRKIPDPGKKLPPGAKSV